MSKQPIKLNQVPDTQWIQENYPKTECILFDMDGTIVNTEIVHIGSLKRTMDEIGENLPLKFIEEEYFGLADELVHQHLKIKTTDVSSFIKIKNRHFLELLKEMAPKEFSFPQIRGFLNDLSKNHPMALVTSSENETTQAILEALDYKRFFRKIITAGDVENLKPSPDPYHLGLSQLKKEKSENFLIFEDSPPGLKAALSTKATVFHVQWW